MTYYVVVGRHWRVTFRSVSLRRALTHRRLHGGLVYPALPGVGVVGEAITDE